tara:strand:- start:2209 stop:3693 length:1485 start_codon:yes stop_codon:yes gene_type:complete
MNKGEIRTRILEQVDWNPSQSTDFKGKVDRLINRAYQTLSLEAPFLFFEEEARIITQPDVSSDTAITADRLAVNSTDQYVLERVFATSLSPAPQAWNITGQWDSRMIEVTTSGGTVYRRRIREIWRDEGGGNYLDRISIDRPWPNSSDSDMTYRIYTAAYELPADVVELRSARLYADQHYVLEVMTQQDMERYEYVDYQGDQVGRPSRLFRGRHWQIDAPTRAPTTSIADQEQTVAWKGPQPLGKFDFCYTYVWGKRESELAAPSGNAEPRWESAPSPISSTVEVSSDSQSITLGLPNVDQELNFYQEHSGSAVVDPIRKGRSGLKKRIYLRRYTSTPSTSVPTIPDIETPEIFFLLAEVDGDTLSYTIDGAVVPDYYRRLKETHGYQAIRFWPMPDNSFDVDCRVLRRPQPLVHDHDAPRVHEEAVDALIQRALIFFYEMNGQYDVSQMADMRYREMLVTLTKRYGQIKGRRTRKRFARVDRPVREVRVVYKP